MGRIGEPVGVGIADDLVLMLQGAMAAEGMAEKSREFLDKGGAIYLKQEEPSG